MAGGEPRLGTTATYMRHNDHGTTRLSTEIDRLHDLLDNEYLVFSAGSVRKWSKFGLDWRWPFGAIVLLVSPRPTGGSWTRLRRPRQLETACLSDGRSFPVGSALKVRGTTALPPTYASGSWTGGTAAATRSVPLLCRAQD